MIRIYIYRGNDVSFWVGGRAVWDEKGALLTVMSVRTAYRT